MIKFNHSQKALTMGAALMLMLTGCVSNTVASTSKPPSLSATAAGQSSPNNATQPLYDTTKIEVSDADMGYVKINEFPGENGQINPVRWQALYETALSLGATGALAWRS